MYVSIVRLNAVVSSAVKSSGWLLGFNQWYGEFFCFLLMLHVHLLKENQLRQTENLPESLMN